MLNMLNEQTRTSTRIRKHDSVREVLLLQQELLLFALDVAHACDDLVA